MSHPGVRTDISAKFDLQLDLAREREETLAEIFDHGKIERIELKAETWQWRRTGNIAIEYHSRGRPSGIATTEADHWVHQVCDDQGRCLVYFMWPIDRVKALCREAYARGDIREGVGDDHAQDVVLVNVRDLIRQMFGDLA